MTDTNAQSYVRETMLPESAPPTKDVGMVKWMRENLFSSITNTILTLIAIYVVYVVLKGLLPWLLGSVWNAGSLTECREVLSAFGKTGHEGACTGVIRDRWLQLIFGFYPSELYWRPLLSFGLLFVALAPILFSESVPKKLMWVTAIFPFLAVWLLWGGAFWTPLLIMAGFIAAYVGMKIGSAIGGQLAGTIVAILAAICWWLFAVPALNGTFERISANANMSEVSAEIQTTLDTVPAQVAILEEERAGIVASIQEAVDRKDTLLEGILAGLESGADVESDRDAMLVEFATMTSLRESSNALSARIFKLEKTVSDGRTLLTNIEALPRRLEEIPEMQTEVGALWELVPASVRGTISVRALDSTDATADEKRAFADWFNAKNSANSAQNIIDNTYREVGRIGLRPVDSREFGGFMLAIVIGVSGIVLSLPLGILLALGRQSHLFFIQKVSVGFIETVRGVPLIVWLFTAQLLLNYFLPPGSNFDLMLRVIIMVTLFSSAYIAEVVRGGLAALPKGQFEAADALGLDYSKSMQLIVLPQALKISIPSIVSTFIGLFKDTTLVVFIGMLDPIGFTSLIRASTDWNGIYWELFIFIGLMFFIFCFSMGRYSLYLENKLQREHR